MPNFLLYKCPCCGDEVYTTAKNSPSTKHPKIREIEAALIAGKSNTEIMKDFELSRGQISGIRYRYWARVRHFSRNR